MTSALRGMPASGRPGSVLGRTHQDSPAPSHPRTVKPMRGAHQEVGEAGQGGVRRRRDKGHDGCQRTDRRADEMLAAGGARVEHFERRESEVVTLPISVQVEQAEHQKYDDESDTVDRENGTELPRLDADALTENRDEEREKRREQELERVDVEEDHEQQD